MRLVVQKSSENATAYKMAYYPVYGRSVFMALGKAGTLSVEGLRILQQCVLHILFLASLDWLVAPSPANVLCSFVLQNLSTPLKAGIRLQRGK